MHLNYNKYRYEYYEVKDTFLKDFMFNLVLDKYPSKEYLYSICNTKIYRSEDRISHTYPITETKIVTKAGSPKVTIPKITSGKRAINTHAIIFVVVKFAEK